MEWAFAPACVEFGLNVFALEAASSGGATLEALDVEPAGSGPAEVVPGG
jgi:hypothetical protein